jgi:hypothetical protein
LVFSPESADIPMADQAALGIREDVQPLSDTDGIPYRIQSAAKTKFFKHASSFLGAGFHG